MTCPLSKQQRSDYFHLDSIEPTTWDCIAALFSGISGSVTISGTDGNLPIRMGDSPSIDAFARLRVSNPTTLFDSQQQYDLNRILWESDITDNSGNADVTHDANGAEAELTVGAGDTIIRQTRRYFRYQPGKSQFVLTTFVFDEPNDDLEQKVGYFDGENGIFFQDYYNEGYKITLRSYVTGSAVDTRIDQSDWNIDKFDGTGPSGYTLDFTKSQIFLIDMEWLGVGRVRCGFVIDGIPYYAHEFLHANVIEGVYMTTANLPVRYEVVGDQNLTGTKTLRAICAQVASEGGFENATGLEFSVSNKTTLRTVTNASYVPLVCLRPLQTFNSITNRARILPETYSVYSDDTSIHYDLVWGATITGGAWATLATDSVSQVNLTATSFSGGIVVESGYVAASNQSRGVSIKQAIGDYPLFLDIDGNHPTAPYTDSLLIAARSLGNDTECGASIEVRETR